MKSKGGAAHFEMIISFVFFVGFVFFLFFVIRPYNTTTISEAVIDGTQLSFGEMAKTNLTEVFIRAKHSGTESCFFVVLPNEIINYDVTGTNSITRELLAGEVNSELMGSGGSTGVNIEDSNANYRNYKVLISDEFPYVPLQGCADITDYTIGSVIERRVLSKNRLDSMELKYFSDYEELKSELKVPEIYDFAVVSEDIDLNMEENLPIGGDIIAKEYVNEVLYPDGTIVNAKFTFKIW